MQAVPYCKKVNRRWTQAKTNGEKAAAPAMALYELVEEPAVKAYNYAKHQWKRFFGRGAVKQD